MDASFNPALDLNSWVPRARSQPDGKDCMLKLVTTFSRNAANQFQACPDGTIDNSFNSQIGANSTINSVAIQGTGKS